MLDFRFIRDNLDAVKQNIKNRFMDADADIVVKLYEERNALIARAEELRARRNELSARMKGKMEQDARQALIDEVRGIKDELSQVEADLATTEERLFSEAAKIPNMAHPDAPVGKEDKDNLEIKRVGKIPSFSFEPRDHVELGEILDIIDFEHGSKVAGPKFYYLKNEGAILEMALVRYAVDFLAKKGFTVMATPDIAKASVIEGIGFLPRGPESNIYALEDTDTCLVGTAEITLGGFYAGDILPQEALPVKFAGISHCFRKEAGAAGQYSRGLYRVHQFTKVEMFVYCKPEDSDAMHEELLGLEEEIFASLEIPYRVVDTCTGDLGAPAYRKFDLEAWMPGRGDFGEITSTSNCTDYQARRLKVRYKSDNGNRLVHMLNGTAIAASRAIISILENFQQEDGTVLIPSALVPYTGFDRILPKSK